jgi:hypothetical protein
MNWGEDELRNKLINDIDGMQISPALKTLWKVVVLESFESDRWDVIADYNGCTAVQDMFHPCPSCYVHDYSWLSGMGGRVADRVFYGLMIAEGMTKGKAYRRWIAVRVGWFAYFRWKYVLRRNWRNPSLSLIDLDNYLNGKN